jgi:hypothetical protein
VPPERPTPWLKNQVLFSDTVGTFVKSAGRLADATAIKFTKPDRTAPAMPEYPSMMMLTRPVATSLIA